MWTLTEPRNLTFIIHFSERVRGCCPSCACLRLCRRAALQIHTIGPRRPGVQHSPKPESKKKKNHLRLKANLSRSLALSSFPFSRSFVLHSPPKKNSLSLASCGFFWALYTSCSPLFLSLSREIFPPPSACHFIDLTTNSFSFSSSSSPLAHVDSLLSVRHGLKNLTDVR